VLEELKETTGSQEAAEKILDYIQAKPTFTETLSHITELAGGEADDTRRMGDLYQMMKAAGIQDTYILDPSITRGLDYYTGVVYETFLDDLPGIGSVCSGGRYDNLAGLYMKDRVPGVGASIGLDRLIAGLTELGLTTEKGSYLDAEIFNSDENLSIQYQALAAKLRAKGISVEVFPDTVKMNRQYAVTESKGMKWGLLMSKEESDSGKCTLKNLKTREQFQDISQEEAAEKILSEK
ncbi:MAG: ATP phosphoribosyltransferase regulatory subunit, partial [Treponema sp.]|nr:ATP phosphoribosyltransferase regulatory subunit [Treponema sp.]